ncbi:LysR family transcriptional regulator [Luteibacter sp. SG786]|uniref:LysR family transcriptional regulator n=1 Tax=Luteibacter sp. SG786 TaxID=2587130 RepID=UPI0014203DFD|nr:LysR family transcriptional regulator [Luteibacter sp. SG786]NII53936.1 DNA-binding transcriptional LysR family regulator [Luteibacter sp. SG786]
MRPQGHNLSSGIGVFAAVVDTGSFTAASESIGMSPPGVSRAIARLERRLNIRLFNRTTRSVTLTEEGRRFYDQVMPHVWGMEEAATAAARGAATVRGTLRVNLDPVASGFLLGAPIAGFMETYPELSLEFFSRDHLGDMVSEGFDVAVRFGEPRSSGLVARKLLDTAVVTVASPAYLARHGHPREPKVLENGQHTCLEFRDPETGRPFPWEFHGKRRTLSVETNGRLTVNDPGALVHACVAGTGIAQMLWLAAAPLIREGRLVNLFPEWMDERFPLHAYLPSRQHVPAKTRAFLDFVVSLAAGERP